MPRVPTLEVHANWLLEFNTKEGWPFQQRSEVEWYCAACEKKFTVRQHCNAKDHYSSRRHRENVNLKLERNFEAEDDSSDSEIIQELVEGLLAADIVSLSCIYRTM